MLFLGYVFTLIATNIWLEILEKAPRLPWSKPSEWRVPLCNLDRRVVAGQQQGQVSEGRQCGKRQRLVSVHSQQQPGPGRPKPSPARRRPPASHQPTQVSRYWTVAVPEPSRPVDPQCCVYRGSSLWFLLDSCLSKTIGRHSNTSPHLKHWRRHWGVSVKCFVTGRVQVCCSHCLFNERPQLWWNLIFSHRTKAVLKHS